MSCVRYLLVLAILVIPLSPLHSQAPPDKAFPLERILEEFIGPYAFSPDNRFKLAAYAELKGRFAASVQTLSLNFGQLGYLSFYRQSCLLRTPNGVFSAGVKDKNDIQLKALDAELSKLFEKIMLLANLEADKAKIHFVDACLARKNIEPFEKIFLRHMLIKFGKFNAEQKQLDFHTDWLPEQSFQFQAPGEKVLVKKHITPLAIRLDSSYLRGYYLNAGGTVYVKTVKRAIMYATGEEYDHNITAFKVFAQQLFVQSVQYIVSTESKRLDALPEEVPVVDRMVTYDSPIDQPGAYVAGQKRQAAMKKHYQKVRARAKVKPLYHQFSWIPMMLALMRVHEINIGDADVIIYFVHQPYFNRIYEQLITEERSKVDAYFAKHELSLP